MVRRRSRPSVFDEISETIGISSVQLQSVPGAATGRSI
jgi:hypothetical protein